MRKKNAENGITLIETLILVAIVSLAFVVAAMAMHASVAAIPHSANPTDDVVHSVAADARAALAYDSAAASHFVSSTWTEDSQTLAHGCTATDVNCVQVATVVTGSTMTISGKNLTTHVSAAIVVPLYQEANDPTTSTYTGL